MQIQGQNTRPFAKSSIGYGDCVIVVTGKSETCSVVLTKNGVNQTRFGALRHNDCIGKSYGSKVATSKGHVHILSLNPFLWSASLPHRTQIIYPADASLIVGFLEVVPGKKIFEAGTGSASLTHFLAQAILPAGHLMSFDFHEGRVDKAQQEVEAHQLSDVVDVMQRDVCSVGFPMYGEPENLDGVDAVMLDLPQPWSLVSNISSVYRPHTGGRFCAFSPCFEQVQRTQLALTECGFVNLKTVECLHRSYDVVRATLNIPNMGQLVYPLCVDEKNVDEEQLSTACLFPPLDSQCTQPFGRAESDINVGHAGITRMGKRTIDSWKKGHSPGRFTWEAMICPQTVGHTGYLTFASWIPSQLSRPE